MQVIRFSGPLTRDVIANYRKLFPTKDLSFFDAEAAPPKMAEMHAA